MILQRHIRRFWPEAAIALIACFFFVRELGTFPASWADEGLFIVVAKMVAGGRGYALPLLHTDWFYPYFLGVGPTLIYPAALSMKIFGLSVTAARLPMVLWLMGATVLFYVFTKKIAGRTQALLATLLLVTFSAYVNTGKPVLGEVPGFTFLLLGLLVMISKYRHRAWLAGALIGLAIVTKVTYGIVLPALAIAWVVSAIRRDWAETRRLTVTGLLAFALFMAWHAVEMQHTPEGGLLTEIQNFMLGGGDTPTLFVLRERPWLLLSVPFLAFSVIFLLGMTGIWQLRRKIGITLTVTLAASITLFLLYYLNGMGWYRLLLPGHLLLLPFVPAGALALPVKRLGMTILVLIIAAQSVWQLDHRGSSASTGGQETAEYIKKNFAGRDLLIEPTEVFARLPLDPHWLFVMPDLSFSLPEHYRIPGAAERCFPIIRKLNAGDIAALGKRAVMITGSYSVITPPASCPASR